jgi:hypothetical protein
MEKDLTFEQNMMPCQAEFNHMDSGEGKITHQERLPGSILPFMEDPQEQMLKIIYNEMVENKKSIDELQLIVRENTEGLHGVKKYLSGCVIKQDENVLIQMIRHEIEQYLKLTELSPGINKEGFALLSQMVSYSYELEKENRELKDRLNNDSGNSGSNGKSLEEALKKLKDYEVSHPDLKKNLNIKKRGRAKK